MEFEDLRDLIKNQKGRIQPGVPLPGPIDDALGALEVYIVNIVMHHGREIRALLYSRPGFSEVCDMTLGADEQSASFRVKEEYQCDFGAKLYREQKMWWLLLQLTDEPDSGTRFSYPMILDLLEDHLATADRQERGRLDDILYAKLSDYLILLEMLFAIQFHRPKTTIRLRIDCQRTENRLAWHVPMGCLLPGGDDAPVQRKIKTFISTEIPSGGKNRQWLEVFDKAHSASQSLWRTITTYHQAHLKKNNLSKVEIEECMQGLQWWDSKSHRDDLDSKRQRVIAGIEKAASRNFKETFLPLPASDDQNSATPSLRPKKIKPRREATQMSPKSL